MKRNTFVLSAERKTIVTLDSVSATKFSGRCVSEYWKSKIEYLNLCLKNPWKIFVWPNLRNAAVAAKSLQSCLTVCNPIDGSPPGSSIPGIFQARILERVAISFSNTCMLAKSIFSLQCLDSANGRLCDFCVLYGYDILINLPKDSSIRSLSQRNLRRFESRNDSE